jgi:hypothetical protein
MIVLFSARRPARKCFVSLVLDRRGLSVRSCKLVFLISDHVEAALNKPASIRAAECGMGIDNESNQVN